MNKHIKKAISIVVLLLLVVYVFVSFIIPKQTIHLFGFRTFIVVSRSMEPEINLHDMIVITKTNESKLEVGDIITFEAYIKELQEYSYVTHYIADIQEDGQIIYKTQGSTQEIDQWKDHLGNDTDITIDDIEGEYQFTIPLVGELIYRLQDPIFLGLLMINGVVVYYLLKSIQKYNQDKRKEINLK